MADETTNVPKDPTLKRMRELIEEAFGHKGIVRCGELELFVKKIWNGDGTPDTLFDKPLFYSALAAMKLECKIGYFGVPTKETQIHWNPEPVWYVI